jgi:hypothetical protein
MHASAFLCIPSFCLLSPLPYSRKAVLFVHVVPRVQEVCRLMFTISHFGVFSLLWTLKYFASFVSLTFAATTKKNSMSAILHFYISNTTNSIQHNTPLHYYKLNMPKMCLLSRFTQKDAHIFISLDVIASTLCTIMLIDLLDNKLFD